MIEVRPEIMQLLDAFDTPVIKASKGSSRALSMLKKNAKKRKKPDFEMDPLGKRARDDAPGATGKRAKLAT